LVTGKKEKLTIAELDELVRQASPESGPIELIALTACETAIGDDRSALGFAGVAIRAGAKSAIASLWSINDAATGQVATQFYRNLLQPAATKAKALQAAQITSIARGGDSAHPARWAPFISIGNWL
jgi:CHAT domain-containing protein